MTAIQEKPRKLEEFFALDLEKHFEITKDEVKRRLETLKKDDEDYQRLNNISELYYIQNAKDLEPRERPCEKCNAKEVYIGDIDIGGINVQWEYWRVCLNCLDTDISNSGAPEQWEIWLAGAGPDYHNPYK